MVCPVISFQQTAGTRLSAAGKIPNHLQFLHWRIQTFFCKDPTSNEINLSIRALKWLGNMTTKV